MLNDEGSIACRHSTFNTQHSTFNIFMRLFIASSFPEPVLRDLNARVSTLRPRLPSASWVRAEAQHLTFAFLGEQRESLIDELAPRVESAVQTIARFEAVLRGCGF